jgi:phage gpG-like protein
MSLQVRIGVTGGVELSRRLQVKASLIKDLRPAWNQIEKIVSTMQSKVFKSKGSAYGLPAWADLKEKTKAYKRKHYPDVADFPLIRTGKLLDAWTKDSSAAVRIKEPLLFFFGVNEQEIPYAKFHQLGVPQNNLAKREHLRIPKGIRSSIIKAIQSHIVKSGQFQRETVF